MQRIHIASFAVLAIGLTAPLAARAQLFMEIGRLLAEVAVDAAIDTAIHAATQTVVKEATASSSATSDYRAIRHAYEARDWDKVISMAGIVENKSTQRQDVLTWMASSNPTGARYKKNIEEISKTQGLTVAEMVATARSRKTQSEDEHIDRLVSERLARAGYADAARRLASPTEALVAEGWSTLRKVQAMPEGSHRRAALMAALSDRRFRDERLLLNDSYLELKREALGFYFRHYASPWLRRIVDDPWMKIQETNVSPEQGRRQCTSPCQQQVLRARWMELYRAVALAEIDATARAGANDDAYRLLRAGSDGDRPKAMARLVASYRRQVLRLSELAPKVAAGGNRSATREAQSLVTELERARQEILRQGYSDSRGPGTTPSDADLARTG